MSFLLCGQTDSGKSTISGNLLYKCNYFSTLNVDDEKYYRKYLDNIEENKSKSKWSILMDLLDGEITTNKSKTQEFNSISFEYNEKNYTLIDTPGHKLYIRALIDGLFHKHLDLVIIVVSSINNEFSESFERGTVKEDLILCRSTGCKNLLILWNKSDLSTINETNRDLMTSYCKKLQFKNIEQLNVSGYLGDGVLDILPIVDKYVAIRAEYPSGRTESESKLVTIDCLIVADALITSGYQCIMHTQTGEYEIVVEGVKGTRILKISTPSCIKVSTIKGICINTFIGDRVIFRNSSTTLGFGVVKSV